VPFRRAEIEPICRHLKVSVKTCERLAIAVQGDAFRRCPAVEWAGDGELDFLPRRLEIAEDRFAGLIECLLPRGRSSKASRDSGRG
jgi:hypothetical protein